MKTWIFPHHRTAFDLTSWNVVPPEAVEDATFTATSMAEWESRPGDTESVARLGDFIDYSDLPDLVATDAVSNWMSGVDNQIFTPNEEGTLVCGSQGEIASNPALDDYFDLESDSEIATFWGSRQRQSVWTMIALGAPDQLRQRMAFALSQIIVVDPGTLTCSRCNELDIFFYDILVRHGLGNYRDILREVAYDPRMGDMLSYTRNKSRTRLWHNDRIDSRKSPVTT